MSSNINSKESKKNTVSPIFYFLSSIFSIFSFHIPTIDPKKIKEDGWNELFFACFRGQYDLLPDLINKYKKKLNDKDIIGRSAIYYTVAIDRNCTFPTNIEKITNELNEEFFLNKIKCFILLINGIKIDTNLFFRDVKQLNLYYIALKFISIIHKKYSTIDTSKILNIIIDKFKVDIILNFRSYKTTPLMIAFENNDLKTFEFLVEKGANYFLFNDGLKLFHEVFMSSDENIILKMFNVLEENRKVFIKFFITYDDIFYYSCQNKLINFSNTLFDEIINLFNKLTIQEIFNLFTSGEIVQLFYKTEIITLFNNSTINKLFRNKEVTKLLEKESLSKTKAINNIKKIKKNLLKKSIVSFELIIVRIILQKLNYSWLGQTPLIKACLNGMEVIAEKLINYSGVDITSACEESAYSYTPLLAACKSNMPEIAKLLIEKIKTGPYDDVEKNMQWVHKGGIDELATKVKNTPLSYACLNNMIEIIIILLDKIKKGWITIEYLEQRVF